MLNKDEVKGMGKQAKGAVKDTLGEITGDSEMEDRGEAEKTQGKAQNQMGKARRKAGESMKKAGRK